ncbi:hypothetical protein GIB67_020589 [Kingdonia uniflora]|uniref:GED domain-containing protein n=1 Tax=Kingdonia uniflora TaxID=39325 RepID=A0A7J7NVN3_9MAGN|nr:hypothetical protein GIB67_020589 [Kingdonia uniflora]
MPSNLSTMGGAISALMRILASSKESLKKILVRGEFDEYPDEAYMHCTARLAEMLDVYSKDLQNKKITADNFLMDEIRVFMKPEELGFRIFFPVLLSSLFCKEMSVDRVKEIVEMEKLADYTSNPDYMKTLDSLMGHQENFTNVLNDKNKSTIGLPIFGDVEVVHLRKYSPVVVQQAFDMKMQLTAYWKIVLLRLVDRLGLHLVLSVQNLVNNNIEDEIVKELLNSQNGGMEKMLEESPVVVKKREKLNKSIKLLQDSKEVVSNIMDRMSADGGPAH